LVTTRKGEIALNVVRGLQGGRISTWLF
jgi:hypothetical protein